MTGQTEARTVAGQVRWFNPAKGFGFLTPDDDGPDLLLHEHTLIVTGRSSIAEGVRLVVKGMQVNGRWQVLKIEEILNAGMSDPPKLDQLATMTTEDVRALPYEAARVKWYDIKKGIGFANTLGAQDDVFLHAEVLRVSGLISLQAGEAVIIKTVVNDRGRIAVEVNNWFDYRI